MVRSREEAFDRGSKSDHHIMVRAESETTHPETGLNRVPKRDCMVRQGFQTS